ncbi:MAG: DCC1-like thiol-disulfide oxidoreductase family protein [Myxococcota bacterium]|nr:DCC1-like thiol-disulfide oxidoreductase family protein [Myxococcota bacterium]
MNHEPDIVLWDGDCAFCRRGILWFKNRDSTGRLQMVPYQQAPSPPMTPTLARACRKSLYVIHPDGNQTRAGRAILFLFEAIGFKRLARLGSRRPLVWAIEFGYWLVARNRQIVSRFLFTREESNPDP